MYFKHAHRCNCSINHLNCHRISLEKHRLLYHLVMKCTFPTLSMLSNSHSHWFEPQPSQFSKVDSTFDYLHCNFVRSVLAKCFSLCITLTCAPQFTQSTLHLRAYQSDKISSLFAMESKSFAWQFLATHSTNVFALAGYLASEARMCYWTCLRDNWVCQALHILIEWKRALELTTAEHITTHRNYCHRLELPNNAIEIFIRIRIIMKLLSVTNRFFSFHFFLLLLCIVCVWVNCTMQKISNDSIVNSLQVFHLWFA